MQPARSFAPFPTWPGPHGDGTVTGMVPVAASLPPAVTHVVPSLSLGGAERIGLDLVTRALEAGREARLMVMRDAPEEHATTSGGSVTRLGHLPWPDRIASVARASRNSGGTVYCHLTGPDETARLWDAGVETVPVVHNVGDGWKVDPGTWASPMVPFVVACGSRVEADLVAAACPVPVVALRHLVLPRTAPDPDTREAVRAAFGTRPGELLVGMVGRVVPQKDYARAVRVLHALLARGTPARLVVVGATRDGEDGNALREAVSVARELGIRDRVLFVGGVPEAARITACVDVFLNTSRFEGVSIATMEAVACGIPVVSTDVGGQREAVGTHDVLLPSSAPPEDFSVALARSAGRARRVPDGPGPYLVANTDLWAWCAAFRSRSFRDRPVETHVLFVTGNLDVGGAQRGLSILAPALARVGHDVRVAVCGPVGVPDFLTAMTGAGVTVLGASGSAGRVGGPAGRLARVLGVVMDAKPYALCLWNMDAATKMALAKVLSGTDVRIVDASPGPALFRELDEETEAAAALTTDPARYLRSLDVFVAKYGNGLPPVECRPRTCTVVANGVEAASTLPEGTGPRPEGDPSKAVLVVGRLDAAKRIDLLPAVARGLAARVPGATVTVVGGVHEGSGSGLRHVPDNLRLLPPDTRTRDFASRFAVGLVLSREQGCPNTSLEFMAAGIPVVANDDGGTHEQVLDGVTGYLVPDGDDVTTVATTVDRISRLLADPASVRRMGDAARSHVGSRFTVGGMVDGYRRALFDDGRGRT